MKTSSTILNLGNWSGISDVLAKELGLVETMVLMKHVYYTEIKGTGYDDARQWIYNSIGISTKIQRRVEKVLIDRELLTIEKKGQGGKNHFIINLKNLVKLSKSLGILNTTTTKSLSGNVSLPGGTKHILKEEVFNKLNTTEQKTLCAKNNKPSRLKSKEPPVQKSRLMDKGIAPVQTKTNPLIERTNIASGNKPIPKRTLRCIEYWNQNPELTQHKTDKYSSTIKQIVKLMGNFFEGNFLNVVSIPRTFKDSTWFNRKPTIEEFFEIVDDFVFCIKSPDIKPVCNGTRYSLLDFLQGNQYMNADSGGVPSLMLTYCFGEYQTIVPDNNPESTKKIKDMWTKHIGRFHDTPSTEKAFVIASNICAMRFEEKRKEEENWIPAMNDYRPEGIVRQIIIDKAEWFKKEKKPPEIMASSFFTSIIRRYDYNKQTGSMTL